MTDISPAVAKLQSGWHSLPDLDRAHAVHAIKRAGISTREIALHLNVSESLLRHLLHALQAPIEDRFLAQKRRNSTNELVRRARAEGIRRSNMHRETPHGKDSCWIVTLVS
jgi:transposase-like protein